MYCGVPVCVLKLPLLRCAHTVHMLCCRGHPFVVLVGVVVCPSACRPASFWRQFRQQELLVLVLSTQEVVYTTPRAVTGRVFLSTQR